MENLLLNELYLHSAFSLGRAKLMGIFEGDLFLKFFNNRFSMPDNYPFFSEKVRENVEKSKNSASLLVIKQVGSIGLKHIKTTKIRRTKHGIYR